VLAACVLAAGCTRLDTAPASGEGERIEIRQGTTAGFEGLRIGLANIISSDYAGKRHGLAAVLVLFIDGNPPREKQFEARAGQEVEMEKYSLYVQEIRGGSKGSVTLRVKEAGHPPVP